MGEAVDRMMAGVTDAMKDRTGRDLDEWVAVVQGSGLNPLDQKAVRTWLRTEHGVKLNSQWAIADAAAKAAGHRDPTLEEYVAEQYAGPKTALRPIYDAVAQVAMGLGDDVRAEGRATYIPFVRRRQFAAVAAATRTRVDLGLRYTDPPANKRLLSKGLPAQATHRVALESVGDVDSEVADLLHAAYEQNG
jgi:predicted transport protein